LAGNPWRGKARRPSLVSDFNRFGLPIVIVRGRDEINVYVGNVENSGDFSGPENKQATWARVGPTGGEAMNAIINLFEKAVRADRSGGNI
jgi:hypothetical protein